MQKSPGVCLLFFSLSLTYGQVNDTTFLKMAVENAAKLYASSIQGQTNLYTGSQYKEPNQADDQHPFFGSDDWVYGTITFDGEHYENIPMLYDITEDKLITENYYNAAEIVLFSEKVDDFRIDNHIFLHISKETANNSLPKSGFYELLYKGTTKLLARRQKELTEKIESSTILTQYEIKDRYFVYKNGMYFPVRTKRSILNVLANQKQALRKFIAKNKIRFKGNQELALMRIASQYDVLISTQ